MIPFLPRSPMSSLPSAPESATFGSRSILATERACSHVKKNEFAVISHVAVVAHWPTSNFSAFGVSQEHREIDVAHLF
jgi:hypothetical protein